MTLATTRAFRAPVPIALLLLTLVVVNLSPLQIRGSDSPAPNEVAAKFLGVWRAVVKVDGKDVPLIDIHGPDSYALFVEGQAAPFSIGKFEVTEKTWKNIPEGKPVEEGTYHFVDKETVAVTGKSGQEVIWKRVGISPAANAPAPNNPPANPGDAGAGIIPPEQPVPATTLADFVALRKRTGEIAGQWNQKAQLFRVDLQGAYTHSKFKVTTARFFYFVPKAEHAALVIKIDAESAKSQKYPFDPAHEPRALPDDVLSSSVALTRLWDLAPTVRHDQIYLQLLWPGVEKSGSFSGVAGYDSDPSAEFLKDFPVALKDDESTAPHDRCVWRILGVRDYNVVVDRAYAAYLYIDARTGAALSARRPADGVQIFMRHALIPPTPIQPWVFAAGPIPSNDPSEQVGTFDALKVAQKSESLDWGLRAMVRDGKSDADIKAAIAQVDAWATRIEQIRSEDVRRGVEILEQTAHANPGKLQAQIALLNRYVNEIEKEKATALSSPTVIKLSGTNKDRESWLGRQFEITPECLGTQNQTHMILDLKSGEWLFKMEDPPNTGVHSKYIRAAMQLLNTIRATKQHDFELERIVTRLNWLILGNGAAVGDTGEVSPIDPLQLMCYAEFNRVIGSQNLVAAAVLRAPKTWSSSSRRDLGNGTTEITSTTYTRPATAEEIAAADRLDAMVNQVERPGVSAVQDLALKMQSLDPRPYFLWGRIEATFYDLQLADRIIERGLMIDPGSTQLHAARCIAWMTSPDVNKAEVYCVDRMSKPYTPADLQGGNALAKLDPMAGYFLALQRLRLAPTDIAAHATMGDVLNHLDGFQVKANQGVNELMPDAREQHQRQMGVAALIEENILDHPDQWSKGVPPRMPATRENLMKLEASLLVLRAEDLVTLDRKDEAQKVYRKVLGLDPANAAARQAMQ